MFKISCWTWKKKRRNLKNIKKYAAAFALFMCVCVCVRIKYLVPDNISRRKRSMSLSMMRRRRQENWSVYTKYCSRILRRVRFFFLHIFIFLYLFFGKIAVHMCVRLRAVVVVQLIISKMYHTHRHRQKIETIIILFTSCFYYILYMLYISKQPHFYQFNSLICCVLKLYRWETKFIFIICCDVFINIYFFYPQKSHGAWLEFFIILIKWKSGNVTNYIFKIIFLLLDYDLFNNSRKCVHS